MMLEKAGVPATYIYNAKDSSVDALIKSLRAGDQVMVSTLGRLATRRDQLGPIIEAIHKKGATVVEMATDRRSDGPQAVQMALDAAAELALDARGISLRDAKKFSAMGGLATKIKVAREMEAKRLGKTEARNIWKNPLLTNSEALEQMTGWTQASAYRRLGTRKLAIGRRRRENAEG